MKQIYTLREDGRLGDLVATTDKGPIQGLQQSGLPAGAYGVEHGDSDNLVQFALLVLREDGQVVLLEAEADAATA